MAENEEHLFANDGTDWTSEREPHPSETEEAPEPEGDEEAEVDVNEARNDEQKTDEEAREGDGFTGTNEGQVHWTSVEDSAAKNGPLVPEDSDDETK